MTDTRKARSEILARIRSAIGHSTRAESAEQEMPRDYRQTGTLSRAAVIDLFVDRLRDYGAGVSTCPTSELHSAISKVLRQRNKKRIAAPLDIDPAWLPEDANGCAFIADDSLSYEDLDRCDGVLTGCTVAIAETGTLALCHKTGNRVLADEQPGQGRRALTLIPDYHLCVVNAFDVVETVPEAIRALEPYKMRPITLISGPSATADIEMTRIQGVHGPRVLDVVLVI